MKEIELTCKIGREISEVELKAAAAKALGVSPKSVGACRLVRRSVDARTDVRRSETTHFGLETRGFGKRPGCAREEG